MACAATADAERLEPRSGLPSILVLHGHDHTLSLLNLDPTAADQAPVAKPPPSNALADLDYIEVLDPSTTRARPLTSNLLPPTVSVRRGGDSRGAGASAGAGGGLEELSGEWITGWNQIDLGSPSPPNSPRSLSPRSAPRGSSPQQSQSSYTRLPHAAHPEPATNFDLDSHLR